MTLEELKELKHPKCFYTKEETDAILKSISQKVVVEQLPEYGNEGYLYLVPSIADPNIYEQFIWNNDTWESLGNVNKEEYLDYVTNPELDIALNDKQDKLTFDSTPTLGSSNPVTSGGVYTALQGKQDVSPITNAASGALTVNEYRDFGSVSALTVTLSGGTMANYDLYKFSFTCASDATTLTLPSGVKLPVDMEMEMATGRRFECVIDYASCLTFNCWD